LPVLRMGNLGQGKIAYDDLKFLPHGTVDSKLLLQPGDLLFNRTNSAELVGKTAVFRGYREDIAFASYLIRVRPLPSANLEWASIVLNSAIGRRYVAEVRTQQVGQANVNGTKLAAAPIPLPSADEQSRIIAEYDRIFSVIDSMEDAAIAALERGRKLRSSVLSAAFTGNLVSRDEEIAA
jgi:type I restriction enzyme S subunit